MKTLLVPLALVAVATVAAAPLKDPATLADSWNRTVASNPPPNLADLGLKERSTVSPALPVKDATAFEAPESAPPPMLRPQPRTPDAPGTKRPRGAKPYLFDGETYWLVPLARDASV